MSAKGQKLTRGLVSRDVRFVPKADIITINGEKRRGGGQSRRPTDGGGGANPPPPTASPGPKIESKCPYSAGANRGERLSLGDGRNTKTAKNSISAKIISEPTIAIGSAAG
jgi:hypothetical protein